MTDLDREELEENLKYQLDMLFDFFELDNQEGEWPFISIYSQGSFYTGPIPDELYDLLINLKEYRTQMDELSDE